MRIEGAGKKHLTEVIDLSVIDQVVQFEYQDALDWIALMLQKENFFPGYTGAANIAVCQKLSKSTKGRVNIVTVVPDIGYKYIDRLIKELS